MRKIHLLAVLLFFGCSKPIAPPATVKPTPAVQLDVSKLQAFANVDLRGLYGQQFTDFQQHVASLIPEPNGWFAYWNLWQIKTPSGSDRFVLFLGCPLTQTPGGSFALIHVIDETGKLRSSTEFSTGWRINIESATCDYSDEFQDYLIRVVSYPDDGGLSICRQIYGLLEDRPILLWKEDCHGKLFQKPNQLSNDDLVPVIPEREAAEWEAALKSSQPIAILEALLYLEYSSKNSPDSTSEQARIALLKSPQIRQRLEQLRSSKIVPIQDAAQKLLMIRESKDACCNS